ncbi:hypothetical protein OsJ_30265 [Oryza sativa Japonica Group]|uniref:Uncharacterized protein n=1 Tax=Oryza sativa subsp. japonica TaxID=39947 RepID=A3C1B0_ORYSJ|nr:hypothetical protein OsJ_30265 [Oryza sativa Japonica Group]
MRLGAAAATRRLGAAPGKAAAAPAVPARIRRPRSQIRLPDGQGRYGRRRRRREDGACGRTAHVRREDAGVEVDACGAVQQADAAVAGAGNACRRTSWMTAGGGCCQMDGCVVGDPTGTPACMAAAGSLRVACVAALQVLAGGDAAGSGVELGFSRTALPSRPAMTRGRHVGAFSSPWSSSPS